MKRLEPNLLLAVTTGLALLLLLVTASVFGSPGAALRYGGLAVASAVLFILLDRPLRRMLKIRPRPPLIRPDSPGSAAWAGLLPMLIIVAAFAPMLWPGRDYGLLIIIAAVWFGLVGESAFTARRTARGA